MPTLDNTPSWFLKVAVTALIALLPLLILSERRITVLEAKQEVQAVNTKRLILLLDRLDITVGSLNTTVASLKVEINNIKER